MRSKTDGSSNHGAQVIEGNLEEAVEAESAALENLQEPKETGSVKRMTDLSTIGTQTPLTLVRLTQSSLHGQFTDSTTLPTRFSYEIGHDLEESRENVISFPRKLLQSETSATLSREATTQATPPHPSLVPKTFQDTMQTSASFISSTSGQNTEVLTVTTDYAAPSPDARSLLVDDVVNESDNDGGAANSCGRSAGVLDTTSSSNRETISGSTRSSIDTSNQQWSFASCLQCVPIANDEVYEFPYRNQCLLALTESRRVWQNNIPGLT